MSDYALEKRHAASPKPAAERYVQDFVSAVGFGAMVHSFNVT